MENLIYLMLGLALIGFLVWLIQTYIPMNEVIKNLITVVVVIAVILYLLNRFNILSKF